MDCCFVVWSTWDHWSCSVTCGRGTETRKRRCMSGNDCRGNSEESRACNKQTCPGETNKTKSLAIKKQPGKFALSQQSTNLNSYEHWIFSRI